MYFLVATILSACLINRVTAISAAPVQTILVPGDADQASYVGSVVGVNAPSTTYAVQCAPGTDSSDCGISEATITIAPNAYDVYMTDGLDVFSLHCSGSGTAVSSCFYSGVDGNDGPSAISVTSSSAAASDVGDIVPVTITAGEDKLTTPASSSSSAATISTGASPSAVSSKIASGTSTGASPSAVSSKIASGTSTGASPSAVLTSAASATNSGATAAPAKASANTFDGAPSLGYLGVTLAALIHVIL